MQKSLVACLAQLIIGCWNRKAAFLLYRVCMASAICKQLKKTGDIYLSSCVFGKRTRTQPIDESLNPALAVDGFTQVHEYADVLMVHLSLYVADIDGLNSTT
jgi:hypothetical protein